MQFSWELRSRLEGEEKREQPWEPLAPQPWGRHRSRTGAARAGRAQGAHAVAQPGGDGRGSRPACGD